MNRSLWHSRQAPRLFTSHILLNNIHAYAYAFIKPIMKRALKCKPKNLTSDISFQLKVLRPKISYAQSVNQTIHLFRKLH